MFNRVIEFMSDITIRICFSSFIPLLINPQSVSKPSRKKDNAPYVP